MYNRTHNDTGLDRFVQVQVSFVCTYIQRTAEYDLDGPREANLRAEIHDRSVKVSAITFLVL